MRSLRFACPLLLALLWGCAARYAHPLPKEAVVHRARTADGWEIALVQYLPRGTPKGRPVLLSHGISANARHVDLDEEHSLARYLAARGREAWTLSIRGTGDSDRVDLSRGRLPGYSFDTVWQQDLPAAIAYVRHQMATPALLAQAGHPPLPAAPAGAGDLGPPLIDYIGHSMGGMLIYAYLSQGGEGIGAVVTLGSPTRLDFGGPLEPHAVAGSRRLFSERSVIPMAKAATLSMPLQGRIPHTPLERLLYNPRNTGPKAWRRMVAIGTGDISGALWLQVAGMVHSGRFCSADGAVDYRQDMARITRPVLVVAGKVDRIATPPAVKDGYRALGGPKQWWVAGEENGLVEDYGHMDLLLGQRVEEEVWPRVLEFLGRHP